MKTHAMILLVACGLIPSAATAQSVLDRLEQQIRQRVATPENASPAAAQPADNSSAGYLGLVADDQRDRGRGVRVVNVFRGSPAEKAGLRRDDLITALAGTRIRQMSDLSDTLSMFHPGQAIDLDVLRQGAAQQVRVVLGQRPVAARPPRAASPEIVPAPTAETIPSPPAPQLEPTKPAASEPSRIERLERRLDELERRVERLQEALKNIKKE
jgi:hypothetical protein